MLEKIVLFGRSGFGRGGWAQDLRPGLVDGLPAILRLARKSETKEVKTTHYSMGRDCNCSILFEASATRQG